MQKSVRNFVRCAILAGLTASLGACGGGGLFGKRPAAGSTTPVQSGHEYHRSDTSIWDLFGHRADPNVTVGVNKYLWRASLEVLDFLPVQSADPFSGVLVTGFGTPPGGGRAYRATIYVQDPALDARSLKVALVSKGGPVDPATARAVEDAILTRARQLRIQDTGL